MKQLFPPVQPFATFDLQASKLHRLYVEDCGARDGLPVICLHGGPGSSTKSYHRQFFDPTRYRCVLFDQRGCGRSTPRGELRDNQSQDLIADIERIREHLGIERWVVFGGSWGATLALLYAQTYPQRLSGLILRGSFLARDYDIDWFFRGGLKPIFPDQWQQFLRGLGISDGEDPVAVGYHAMAKESSRPAAAKAWSDWSLRIVSFALEQPAGNNAGSEGSQAIADVGIEAHYAYHRYFLEPDQILLNIEKTPKVPTTIIHGRRDLTCVPESSWQLHHALPGSRLIMVPTAGHLASETAMVDALVTATGDMFDSLNPS